MIKGRAWKCGDDINTDLIIPARYLNSSDPAELARHCMEDLDKEYRISRGDVIAAGKNFGCGSSREHAPVAIKESGAGCVIARSFARIFFRNSINIGLPVFESPEADRIADCDEIEIDEKEGLITNLTKNETYKATQMPVFIQQIIDKGGLAGYVKSRVKQ
ncbi:MAG: 3-isopropylmalate dehydratase small subunit [archaeon]